MLFRLLMHPSSLLFSKPSKFLKQNVFLSYKSLRFFVIFIKPPLVSKSIPNFNSTSTKPSDSFSDPLGHDLLKLSNSLTSIIKESRSGRKNEFSEASKMKAGQLLAHFNNNLIKMDPSEVAKHLNLVIEILNATIKIDKKLLASSSIEIIISNILPRMKDPLTSTLILFMYFFNKINERNKSLWNLLFSHFKTKKLDRLSTQEQINVLWILSKVEYEDSDLYSKLNDQITQNSDRFVQTLTFYDISMLSLVYKHKNDSKSVKKLEEIIYAWDKSRNLQIRLHPRDISTTIWSLSHFPALITRNTWRLLIEKYLNPNCDQFQHGQDISLAFYALSRLDHLDKQLIKLPVRTLLKNFKMNTHRGTNEGYKFNEQDLSTILESALKFELLGDEEIKPVLDLFLKKIDELKPIGIGYCLRRLVTQRKDLFQAVSGTIIETYLNKKLKPDTGNWGTLISVFSKMNHEKAPYCVEMLTNGYLSFLEKDSRNMNAVQFYYAFHSLEDTGTIDAYYKKFMDLYLEIPVERLFVEDLLHYSIFLKSLTRHHKSFSSVKDAQFMSMIKKKSCITLINLLTAQKELGKGFGICVYNIVELEMNDHELWQLIQDKMKGFDFGKIDMRETLSLLKGIMLKFGKSTIEKEVKEKIISTKIGDEKQLKEVIESEDRDLALKYLKNEVMAHFKGILAGYKKDEESEKNKLAELLKSLDMI